MAYAKEIRKGRDVARSVPENRAKIERPGERFKVKPIKLAGRTIAGVTHSFKDVEAL